LLALLNVWASLERPASLYAKYKVSESQHKVQCQNTGLFQCQGPILHLALILLSLVVEELALQVC